MIEKKSLNLPLLKSKGKSCPEAAVSSASSGCLASPPSTCPVVLGASRSFGSRSSWLSWVPPGSEFSPCLSRLSPPAADAGGITGPFVFDFELDAAVQAIPRSIPNSMSTF